MPWSFNGQELWVLDAPKPVFVPGLLADVIEYPGVDLADIIPDRLVPVRVRLNVAAWTAAEHETLLALFLSRIPGDFERPMKNGAADDHWVYADARANPDGGMSVEDIDADHHILTLEIVCPDPRPRWKSSGERVY